MGFSSRYKKLFDTMGGVRFSQRGAGFYTFYLLVPCVLVILLVMTSDTLVIEDMEPVRARLGCPLSAALRRDGRLDTSLYEMPCVYQLSGLVMDPSKRRIVLYWHCVVSSQGFIGLVGSRVRSGQIDTQGVPAAVQR